ncbi:MAG: hypothetical protein U1F25_17995 [Rubrivivax sp.]
MSVAMSAAIDAVAVADAGAGDAAAHVAASATPPPRQDADSCAAQPADDHRHDIDVRRLLFFQAQQRQLRWPILAAVVLVALLLVHHVPWPLLAGWVLLAVVVREWRSRLIGRLVAHARQPIGTRLSWLIVSNAALGCSHGLAAAFMPWLDTTSAAAHRRAPRLDRRRRGHLAPLPRAYAGYAVGTLGRWRWPGCWWTARRSASASRS